MESLRSQMEQQCRKNADDISKYKAHISDLTSRYWDVGEKLLAETQEKQLALKELERFKGQPQHQQSKMKLKQQVEATTMEVTQSRHKTARWEIFIFIFMWTLWILLSEFIIILSRVIKKTRFWGNQLLFHFLNLHVEKKLEKAVACMIIFNTASTMTNLSLNSQNPFKNKLIATNQVSKIYKCICRQLLEYGQPVLFNCNNPAKENIRIAETTALRRLTKIRHPNNPLHNPSNALLSAKFARS